MANNPNPLSTPAPPGQPQTPASVPTPSAANLKDVNTELNVALSQPSLPPPTPVQFPELPERAHIDPDKWQGLGAALTAVAAVAGVFGHHWNLAGNFLAGAMEGVANGQKEEAAQQYQQYKEAFDRAYKLQDERYKEYDALLKNRSTSINEIISRYRLMATVDHNDDMVAAASQRNWIAMQHLLISRQEMLHKFAKDSADAGASLVPGAAIPKEDMTAAYIYLSTGKTPPMYGRGTKERERFRAAVEAVKEQTGLSDMAFANMVGSAGAKVSAQHYLEKRLGQAESAEATFQRNMDLALEIGKKIPLTQFPLINQAIINGEKASGNADVVQFQNYLSRARTEYARISVGNFGSGGLTNAEQAAFDDRFGDDLSHGQLQALADSARKELANSMYGYRKPVADFENTVHVQPMQNPDPNAAVKPVEYDWSDLNGQ